MSVPVSISMRGSALLRSRLLHARRGILDHSRWVSQANGTSRDRLQRRLPLAFTFDIDGVLIRGNSALPQAKRALRILNGENDLGIKIPYIFLTNGGGVSETVRCQQLSKLLDVEFSVNQFMQAHTILKSIAHEYADKPILALGGRPGAIPRVAEEYGFGKVCTTLEILNWNPSIWPFHDLTEDERAYINSCPKFDPTTRFAGVFVFHDPRNWALDAQITCDILSNNGYILPAPMLPSTEVLPAQKDGDVRLVFCNPDLVWGNEYPASRIGQGSFRVAIQAVYKALHSKEYPYVQYGKPTKATYAFAEELLRARLGELLQERRTTNEEEAKDYSPNVYMVGDNPESDIAGANAKGWNSILVKTGVYDPARGPPTHEPTHIADDVEQAVHWAIARELSRVQ